MRILGENIYNEKTSLKQDIERISDRKIEITDEALINIITKYFFSYIYKGTHDMRIPLDEIEEKFAWATNYYKALQRLKNKQDEKMRIKAESNHEYNFYNNLFGCEYGLAMLGDIAPTVAIVKDIVRRKINPSDFDGKYTGLDLGTGSGILLLAQYIQALRNKFYAIENIGIELRDNAAAMTGDFISQLNAGKVFQGDTTEEKIYNALNINGPITFISNENIPTSSIVMDGKDDPFHQNNKILYGKEFSKKLSQHTQTFPSKIAMALGFADGATKTLVGHHHNAFGKEYLENLENDIKDHLKDKLSTNRSIFGHIYAKGILLDSKIVPMHQIGDDLIANGKVKHLHDWYPRRGSDEKKPETKDK